MAWGGGTFTVLNKDIAGSYFNFSTNTGTIGVFGDRGVTAVPMALDWGEKGSVLVVDREAFFNRSVELFGYDYTHEKMVMLRELFYGTKVALIYRVGSGEKATNTFAEAKYEGVKGNEISIVIKKNFQDETAFDVLTLNNGREVDLQTVKLSSELIDNAWIVFKKDGVLTETAGMPLSGGTTVLPTGEEYQNALKEFENYYFNTLICPTDDETTKLLFINWTKRVVRDVGVYHQLVLHDYDNVNDEYIIDVNNTVKDEGVPAHSLVYYVGGIQSGCETNKDTSGHVYRGEFNINMDGYDKLKLTELKKAGKYVFHKVGNNAVVLEDVNTFTEYEPEKGKDFSWNQCIRVLNQRANDVQLKFNSYYLGKAGTDANARQLFKNDIVEDMQNGLAKNGSVIDYNPADTTIQAGSQPRSYLVSERLRPNYAVLYLYQYIIVTRQYAN